MDEDVARLVAMDASVVCPAHKDDIANFREGEMPARSGYKLVICQCSLFFNYVYFPATANLSTTATVRPKCSFSPRVIAIEETPAVVYSMMHKLGFVKRY